jgi:hypothetical protein
VQADARFICITVSDGDSTPSHESSSILEGSIWNICCLQSADLLFL